MEQLTNRSTQETITTEQNNNSLDDIQKKISPIITNNILGFLATMNWSQAKLGEQIHVSAATVNNYIHGSSVPTVLAFAKMQQICQKKGIEVTIDDFLFHKVDFSTVIEEEKESQINGEYLGHYYIYFFDQTTTADVNSIHRSRSLRYGVISAFLERHVVGDDVILLRAKFFKNLDGAIELRRALDAIQVQSDEDLYSKILDAYSNDKEIYSGVLTFSNKHLFFDLSSTYYGDKALAIFSIPPKKDGNSYIGGLGNIVSVSHGLQKVPVSQKAIISAVQLNASSDQIGMYLHMNHPEFSTEEEAETLLSLYKSLYPADEAGNSLLGQLDEQDKAAIFHSRLHQLITGAADKFFYSVSYVSDTDDKEVYALIKSSQKAQIKGTVTGHG